MPSTATGGCFSDVVRQLTQKRLNAIQMHGWFHNNLTRSELGYVAQVLDERLRTA
jgi:hypothetical protein